jgi:hypothetical protein
VSASCRVQSYLRPVSAGHLTAGLMLVRRSGPNHVIELDARTTAAGLPDLGSTGLHHIIGILPKLRTSICSNPSGTVKLTEGDRIGA